MAKHNELGKWGEDMAAALMERQGFEILARHWQHEHKEVDIIAQKEGTLYFVEVKTATGKSGRRKMPLPPRSAPSYGVP